MYSWLRKLVTIFMVTSVGPAFLGNSGVIADDHVVKSADLHKAILEASQARQDNIAKVRGFFSSERGRNALKAAKVDYVKVDKAIPLLDDEELARLASRTEKIQSDFAAGALNNQELTYIVIALAAAVIVLVIVAA